MVGKLKSFWVLLVGDPMEIGSERYFIRVACIIPSVFLVLLCIVHLSLSLNLAPVLYAGGSALIIFGLYLIVRLRSCLFYPKLILSVFGLILVDFTWYSKFLSNGPVLMFIMIYSALLLWVWDGKGLMVMLSIYFLNIAALFLIEKSVPETLLVYNMPDRRVADIYVSFALYSAMLIFLLYIVKRELTRQTEQALQSDKLKSAFLSNMSHEIRTPLNAIIGFSQLLSEDLPGQSKQQCISNIQKGSYQLLHLIDDILVLSKIEAGQFELTKRVFNLKEIFSELYDTFSIIALTKNKREVEIKYEIEGDGILLNTDPFRLKQALSNLIDNAIKFTTHGNITFSCRRDGYKLLFTVSDTGIGIPPEDQKIIFERFARFDYDGMNPDGTGIGLSIAQKIISSLDGHMWVNSTVGEGTTFSFTLPSTVVARAPEIRGNATLVTKPSVPMNPNPILIVEDDLANSLIIKKTLEIIGIKSHHVTNGYDAIGFVKENPGTALILMDLKLPKLSGYEAAKRIKEIAPGIPIIAQTAYAMYGDREKALEAGCDDYISKPYDLQDFKKLILRHLE